MKMSCLDTIHRAQGRDKIALEGSVCQTLCGFGRAHTHTTYTHTNTHTYTHTILPRRHVACTQHKQLMNTITQLSGRAGRSSTW